MTIYTKCNICNKWTEEIDMDYFTEIGDVCPKCKDRLLKGNKEEKQK